MRTARDVQLSPPALLLPSIQVNIRGTKLASAGDDGVAYLHLPLDAF